MERWQQIDSLFQEALQRPAKERDAWLREACATDAELHREVAFLLANHYESASAGPWAAAAAQLIVKPVLLEPGQSLGPYKIVSFLAAGGMGEVYRARDTKLKRDVALKVLPEEFARDRGRMRRFQREAEVLASLNHPNIAHIYGVEEPALVMEFVEGESPIGPLPFEDAWKIASQIADGLSYAHDKGIVHRDLKPANTKVTPDGVVKLLDFGLAKAYSEAPGTAGADPGDSPTVTLGGTLPGVILGTASYMSPEQAHGKSVDKRADIWAFGVVLYELLTGKQLFRGEDPTETLASIVKEQPDLQAVPQGVRKLLGACLEKDPKKRLRDVGDASQLLEQPERSATRASTLRLQKLPWLVAGLAGLAVFALALVHFREAPHPERLLRYTIAAPENGTVHSFAVSPDGRSVAIAAVINGNRQLWVRPLNALESQALPGTDGAAYPFWSPDSRFIGFFAQNKLKKIAAGGGPPQSLCDAEGGRGGSWSRDDIIIFGSATIPASGIQSVPAAGGTPTVVVKSPNVLRLPVFLPDKRHFLYQLANGPPERRGTYLASLDGKENRRVLADDSNAVFAPPAAPGGIAHLVFLRENTLMAQRFDAASARSTGDAFPVAEGISFFDFNRLAPITVSDNGILLYSTGGGAANRIIRYDRGGKLLGSVGEPGPFISLSISPDQKTVAYGLFRRAAGVWKRDLASGVDTRLTSGLQDANPYWSPKNDFIVFARGGNGTGTKLYRKPVSGSGPEDLLLSTNHFLVVDQWSLDGRFIVYTNTDPKTKTHVWILPVSASPGEGKPTQFLHSEYNDVQGQLSPDGRWMAYTSDESGQREVYLQPFPAANDKRRISAGGGEQPRWRRDGKELFFVAPGGKMMAAAVKMVKNSVETGTPEPLFETHMAGLGVVVAFLYDVSADGKQFLVNTTSEAGSASLTVMANWTSGIGK